MSAYSCSHFHHRAVTVRLIHTRFTQRHKKHDLSSNLCQSRLFLPGLTWLPLFYIVVFSVQTTDSLRLGVCSMCERIYICLCVVLFVCAALHTHTHLHVFLFKWPLVVFPWLSVGYISAAEVKAPSPPTSLSTLVYISFPCLHVALNCPREERDSLCDPSVATDTVGMLKWWGIRACGFICQSFSLHLRLTACE